jgi:hypothetical protein
VGVVTVTANEIRAAESLRPANHLLGDPEQLRSLLDAEGYLFFTSVLDLGAVQQARRDMSMILTDEGFMLSAEGEPIWTGKVGAGIGSPGHDKAVEARYSGQRILERFVANPAIASFFESAVGEPITFLPIGGYRSSAPGDATIPHQDGTYNDGFHMITAWVPLVSVPETLGGLGIAPQTNHQGYLPRHGARLEIDSDALPLGSWHRADYQPGDVVLFSETTVHCGLSNRSVDRLRLSLEVRFQGESGTPAVLGVISSVIGHTLTIIRDDGDTVTIEVGEGTMFQDALSSQRTSNAEFMSSELVPGRRVLASHRSGVAVTVRCINISITT